MLEWLVFSLLGLIIFAIGLGGSFITLSKQAFPDGDQKLATKCELSEIEKNWVKRENNQPQGYFFLMNENQKQPCRIVEERETQVKISYIVGSLRTFYEAEKWIPRKEFHRYYTPQEISDILREKKLVK